MLLDKPIKVKIMFRIFFKKGEATTQSYFKLFYYPEAEEKLHQGNPDSMPLQHSTDVHLHIF